MKLLEGKTAAVTGASRGIGRGIALELAAEGADIVLLDRVPDGPAAETRDAICALGVRCELYPCDVTRADTITAAADRAIRDFGRVDILVNNAGVTRDALLLSMSEEDFDLVIDTNLKGPFLVTKAFIRHFLRNRYGRIINISSVVALTGNPGQANYAASKAGLLALTKTVAKEYAARGITCNAIAPGFIETAMTAAMPASARTAMLEAIPAGRPGTPDDIAKATAYLASDRAAYITGEVIRVDGGLSM